MTESEAKKLLAVLVAAYPYASVPQSTVDLYARAMTDLAAPVAERAALRCIATQSRWPAISEIRALAAEDASGLPGWESAWGEARQAALSVGRYRVPAWSNPALEAAVCALGWDTICNTREEDAGTLRAHFRAAYEAYRRASLEGAQLRGMLRGGQARMGPAAAGDLLPRSAQEIGGPSPHTPPGPTESIVRADSTRGAVQPPPRTHRGTAGS